MSSILINLLILHSLLLPSPTKSDHDRNIFNVTLLHRSSPLLPPSIRQPAAVMRTGSRDYYMEYWIGSSHKKEYGVVDPGSDFVWLQCKPCAHCYRQDHEIFDLNTSSSRTSVAFDSPECKRLDPRDRFKYNNTLCGYRIEYYDGGRSIGKLIKDDITIETTEGHNRTIKNFIIGCGHHQSDQGYGSYASGVIGLDRSLMSLLSQLNMTQFSYCIPHLSKKEYPSLVSFGTTGMPPLHSHNRTNHTTNVVSIPLVKVRGSTGYHVTLKQILIGEDKFSVPVKRWGLCCPTPGNMFIDMGNTYSYIQKSVINRVAKRLERSLGKSFLNPRNDAVTCFNVTPSARFPPISLKFSGNVVLPLPKENFYKFKMKSNNTYCLTFRINNRDGYDSRDIVLGAVTQANFLVGFDISSEVNKVYFKQKECV